MIFFGVPARSNLLLGLWVRSYKQMLRKQGLEKVLLRCQLNLLHLPYS